MKTIIIENTWLTGMNHGWGNGYVVIPKGHPLHGMECDNIEVDVHGGLTFSIIVDKETVDTWHGGNNQLTQDDIGSWMVGFDTAHLADTLENWPKEKVQAETDRLMAQLLNYNQA